MQDQYTEEYRQTFFDRAYEFISKIGYKKDTPEYHKAALEFIILPDSTIESIVNMRLTADVVSRFILYHTNALVVNRYNDSPHITSMLDKMSVITAPINTKINIHNNMKGYLIKKGYTPYTQPYAEECLRVLMEDDPMTYLSIEMTYEG